MSTKRALVVDDSKSARAFLSRILERHEIAVDAAESAEAAIDYLTRHKPDVIFMDHMMPGMDGFQAVQFIKNDPRTSTIPILMYTSQEGDLYLGQARALGAAGVLPKQIKQSDVTKMLFQLRLVADRRGGDDTTFMRMAQGLGERADLTPANESQIVVAPPAPADSGAALPPGAAEVGELLPRMSLEIRAALDASLQKELGALRGFVEHKLDAHAERLHGDVVAALSPPPRAPEAAATPLVSERRAWPAILGWTVAVLALAGGSFFGWQWWRQGAEIAALRTDLGAAYAEVETLRARPIVSPVPAAGALPGVVGPAADGSADPAAILPADDAPDAAAASSTDVALVPASTTAVVEPSPLPSPGASTDIPAAPPATAAPLPGTAQGSVPEASPEPAW
ncbi:MAG TPA: response regulator [Steroidobacteraceae bacterium]|nr:response regulator [Steroidobacteraceae bacterium]